MSGRKAKQVERVIKYRPVSDHEMNVSTVHVHTKILDFAFLNGFL